MNRRLLPVLVLLAACSRGPSEAPPADGPDAAPAELTFGLLPTESSVDASRRWGPLVEHLAAATGVPVKAVTVGDYSALVEALRFGKADLAYLGPKAYVKARDRAGVVPLAQEVPVDGATSYHGLIVAKADRGVESLDALRGGTFAFVEPNSTSGFLVPMVHFLEERGTPPDRFFERVQFAGSHQAVLLAVRAGHVDAGATNDLDLARAVEKGQVREEEFRVLWKSEAIPGSPIVAREALPVGLRDTLRAALVGYDDPEGLERMQNRGFVAVDDAAFDPIRRLEAVKAKLDAEGR